MPEQYVTLEMSVHSITGERFIKQTYDQPNERVILDLSRFPTGIYIMNTIADGKRLSAQKVIRS